MKIQWDDIRAHKYEVGVDHGVFYPHIGNGVPWNGLIAVQETTEKANQEIIYVDGEKRINQVNLGDFSASIEAFTYPDEFAPYDGHTMPMFSGQKRSLFGLSYQTIFANENSRGYKLHLIYNCLAKPTNRNNLTLNADSDILSFQWTITTLPVAFPYERPTAHIYINSELVLPSSLEALEDILYGGNNTSPHLPTIDEVLAIFEANAIYTIVDHGDGTFTADGPDEGVFDSGVDLWTLEWPAILMLSSETYKASTY